MKTNTKTIPTNAFLLTLLAVTVVTGLSAAGDGSRPTESHGPALEERPVEATVAELRGKGAAAVEEMLAAEPPVDDVEARRSWERKLDAVCAQRDCAASGLYWYTDLEAAKAEAERAAKPILSLRLLGRLDEEVSCANSRFFRTVLYPDPRISSLLKERFVLHWQSVRPVPRVRIDYGDGRVLEGTITGNSIHYVLDSRGRLVDALPGLYGPGMFREVLQRGAKAARKLTKLSDERYGQALTDFHRRELTRRDRDLEPLGGMFGVLQMAPAAGGGTPTARQAGRLATSKAATQMPMVRAVSRGVWSLGEPAGWVDLAEEHRKSWELGEESRRLMAAKHRAAAGEDADATIEAFERLVGVDTVRNELLLHSLVHYWLATEGNAVPDLHAFNERVYAELFLTPRSDPWLGLLSPETYLALAPESGDNPG